MSAAAVSPRSPALVDMTVGYTDPMVGVTSWPSTTASWSIQPPGAGQSGARLTVRIAMQPAGLTPADAAAADAASGGAAADVASRFAAIWYQLVQPDVALSVATSLNQGAGQSPIDLHIAIDPLRLHVAGCYAFSSAAATLATSYADPSATPTLADVITYYGVDWQALGLAGAERPIGSLVQIPPGGLKIPTFAVFVAGGTVSALVPQSLDPAIVLADPDNIVLPLNPGVELKAPAAEKAQPEVGLPLAELAHLLNVTPASLVLANKTRPALLAPGFVFSAQGVEVEVPDAGRPGADATLDDIALTFRSNGVPFDAVMVAVANADRKDMFRAGVSLVVNRQIILAGWTLAKNGAGVAPQILAAGNVETIDLLPAGTPLFLTASEVTGLDAAALGPAARTYAIEPGDLLRHNADLAPAIPAQEAGAGLPIPGLAALPTDPAALRIPYRIQGGLTMTDVARLFLSAAPAGSGVSPEEALTQANRALPGTIAGGRTIKVTGQSLPTEAGDSFDAVMARAAPPVTIGEFAKALTSDPQALAAGALLLCPPAKLAGDVGVSPEEVETRYGLNATSALGANAATSGLIRQGVTLRPSPTAAIPTVTTAACDSLNAVVRRFAFEGVSVTIGDVVQGNATVDFLAPGAELLLPPADTELSAIFGEAGWRFPDVIFPLRTWITLARNPDLVDPAFRGSSEAPGAAVRVSSPVPAARSATPERQEEGALTLDVFAAAIETAIPGLKLATGRVLSAERDPAPTDVWAVSFIDPGGITNVSIRPTANVPGADGLQPLSFALRPLSNTLESEPGVEIKTLDPQTGGWGESYTYDYQGVDLEVWARAWLAGMDLMCTASYAAPSYKVAPGPLARLLAAKKLLACAVADGLSPILVTQESDGAIGGDAWRAAREVLYQRLLDRLVPAYDTTAILQFSASVSSPAAAAAARLSGAGKLNVVGAQWRARQLAIGEDPEAWKISQLGNAKTRLGTTTSGTVSFPLRVGQPARHRSVALAPVYVVDELEFGVTPVVSGYEASNWLSFVRRFDQFPPPAFSAELGNPLVPVPLRAYPDLPALVSQSAQTPTDPKSIDDALHWAYVFTYAHQSAAQDQIRLEIEFNRAARSARFAIAEDTLFGALAQYAAASDTLWQILGQLQGDGATSENTVLATALDTYAHLAERVAGLWSAWWGVGSCDPKVAAAGQVRPAHRGLVNPARTAAGLAASASGEGAQTRLSGSPHEFYHYLATLDAGLVDKIEVYVSLKLTRLSADGDVGWPEMAVIRDDGKLVPLTPDEPAGDARIYNFPIGETDDLIPAFTRLAFRCTIGGLHIARYQNANSGVSVIRNAQLLGPEGPQTCTAFVYSTRQLGFPEPVVPLITVSSRLDIGVWTTSAATNPLTPLFAAIFDGDPAGREITVAMRYGYTLAPAERPIETLLPVKLHPRFRYHPATTVQSIIDAAEAWAANFQPVTAGGLWGLSISLNSSADPELDRPLLELRRLVSPLG